MKKIRVLKAFPYFGHRHERGEIIVVSDQDAETFVRFAQAVILDPAQYDTRALTAKTRQPRARRKRVETS